VSIPQNDSSFEEVVKKRRGRGEFPQAKKPSKLAAKASTPEGRPARKNYGTLTGGLLLGLASPFIAVSLLNPALTGSLGQLLADASQGFSGQAALLLPLLTAGYGLHLLFPRHRRPVQMTWAPTLLWSSLVLLAQRMGGQGGNLGQVMDGALLATIGPVGAWMVSVCAIPTSLLLMFRMSLGDCAGYVAEGLHTVQDRLVEMLDGYRDRLKTSPKSGGLGTDEWFDSFEGSHYDDESIDDQFGNPRLISFEQSGSGQSEPRPILGSSVPDPIFQKSKRTAPPVENRDLRKPQREILSWDQPSKKEDEQGLPFEEARSKATSMAPQSRRTVRQPSLEDSDEFAGLQSELPREPIKAPKEVLNFLSAASTFVTPPQDLSLSLETHLAPIQPLNGPRVVPGGPETAWASPDDPDSVEPDCASEVCLTVEDPLQTVAPKISNSVQPTQLDGSATAEPLLVAQEAEEVDEIDDLDEELVIEVPPPQTKANNDLSQGYEIPIGEGEHLTTVGSDGQLLLFPEPAKLPAATYRLPPLALLNDVPVALQNLPSEDKSADLLDALSSFGVAANLLEIVRGPAVTRYELQPARGVKVSRFTSLTNDIALALAAIAVRIEAPIPGKSAIGIEIPNENTDLVVIKDILASSRFRKSTGMSIALGKDLGGNPTFANLQKMPHLLVAGTTGSGKSVCINALILSLLYRFTPRELQFLMIDPKQVELSIYEGIPHLISLSKTPDAKNEGAIICDPKRAALALHQIVELMEFRYGLFAQARVRNLEEYNTTGEEPLPWVVVIIDELADLMMVAAKTVETSICRIAQKARAAGIHLVLATQRPSADVITGLIKVNVPSRIAFAVSSQVDSRVILDTGGAEQLLGKGDMLFCPVDASDPRRIQGCFVTNEEILRIVEWWKAQACPENLIELKAAEAAEADGGEEEEADADDELVQQGLQVILKRRQASASLLQTELKVGYARARRLIYLMEKKGYIGPQDGSKPRKILYGGGEG
jgi:DNA segregation ATPase FtsK/SpoIIIE-like protein